MDLPEQLVANVRKSLLLYNSISCFFFSFSSSREGNKGRQHCAQNPGKEKREKKSTPFSFYLEPSNEKTNKIKSMKNEKGEKGK
jgi:hypothetical protein